MPEPTKTQRWLDLIAYLVGRRLPVTVEELMERVPAYAAKAREGNDRDLAAARRMFERDKDELRALGVPLETIEYSIEYGTQRQEGYRIARRDFYLPYLKVLGAEAPGVRRRPGIAEVELKPEDAEIAVDALRRAAALPNFPFAAEAASALRKLGFDVDLYALAETPVLYAEPAPAAEPPPAIEIGELVKSLADAVTRRKRVRFIYHGAARSSPTERDVAGYALLCRHGHWYLIGHDTLRDDVRVFRIDRMREVEPNPTTPRTADYDVPEDFDVARYTSAYPWELGSTDAEVVAADVRFDFPASLWAARNRHGTLVRELEGGASVRRFLVAEPDSFLRWVLGFAGEARVVAPDSMRSDFTDLARDVAALYREKGGDA